MRQIILDTETTGLSVAEGDRVIELGCVELLNRQITGSNLHFYFKVDRESHPDALRVHGITAEFLRDKPRFEERAQEFLDFIRDSEIIIHNAAFDVGFLDNELALIGKGKLLDYAGKVTDSLLLARENFPGKRNSLDALCDRFSIDKTNRALHGALLDSELLAQVYIHLTRGQNALIGDEKEEHTGDDATAVPRMDLSGIPLEVLLATPQELELHQAILAGIDKASEGKTVWRSAPELP